MMHGSLEKPLWPDYEAAAKRMAEAIQAFLSIPELTHDKSFCRFVGRPEYFDLIVARRRYLDELEGRARLPGDPLNGLHD
jgi:hypothetical protein